MKEYTGPNTLLKAFQLIRQALKNAAPSAGDGIDITETAEGPKIGVTAPVQSIVTQAEFDALPEEQQNKGFYVISDSVGSSGGGGGGSSGDVYSTEETRIGTWIDGKPLYRRTYILNVSCPGLSETVILDNGLPAVDTPAKLYGIAVFPNVISPYPSNKVSAYFINDGKIYISNSNSASGTATAKTCTIEYTKTTDTATVSTAEIVAAALDGLPEEALAEAAEDAGQEVPQ